MTKQRLIQAAHAANESDKHFSQVDPRTWELLRYLNLLDVLRKARQ